MEKLDSLHWRIHGGWSKDKWSNIFFIFTQFWEKLAKIVGLRPKLCGWWFPVWEIVYPPLVCTYVGLEEDLSLTQGANHLHRVLWMNVICDIKRKTFNVKHSVLRMNVICDVKHSGWTSEVSSWWICQIWWKVISTYFVIGWVAFHFYFYVHVSFSFYPYDSIHIQDRIQWIQRDFIKGKVDYVGPETQN